MMGEKVAEWPLMLRLVLSPFLLLWFGARVYLLPCIHVAIQRTARCCCRPCLHYLCCGLGLTFTDRSFPASEKSIGEELMNKYRGAGVKVEWKRAESLKPFDDQEPYHLFRKGIKPEDVKQGALGDCWLVPAILALASTMPMTIKKLFVNRERSWRGKYKVRLFDARHKCWKIITVDDIIPTRNGRPLFAKPRGKELWVVMLEKAIAKFCGSYSAIAGGFESWGLKTLTGNNVFTFRRLKSDRDGFPGPWRRFEFLFEEGSEDVQDPKSYAAEEVHGSDDFWWKLVNYTHGKQYAMCCNIAGHERDRKRKDGLLEAHAYTILRATDTHNQKLIQLRNPWGKNGEWKGAWSNNSEEWIVYPLIRNDVLQRNDEGDETFWMSWEDFCRVWTEITICAKSATASDLALDIHEDLGCPGPCVGCLAGCFGYWCLCRGCKQFICPIKS